MKVTYIHHSSFMAELEHAGQGHRRIHMSGRPAAGKQNVHANTSYKLTIDNFRLWNVVLLLAP